MASWACRLQRCGSLQLLCQAKFLKGQKKTPPAWTLSDPMFVLLLCLQAPAVLLPSNCFVKADPFQGQNTAPPA
jgi:hypothetical protein